jgi:hypothetical protein
MEQQEGGDENMLQEAEDMNDGQPVAQAQEHGCTSRTNEFHHQKK